MDVGALIREGKIKIAHGLDAGQMAELNWHAHQLAWMLGCTGEELPSEIKTQSIRETYDQGCVARQEMLGSGLH